jgi:hypothetical protein
MTRRKLPPDFKVRGDNFLTPLARGGFYFREISLEFHSVGRPTFKLTIPFLPRKIFAKDAWTSYFTHLASRVRLSPQEIQSGAGPRQIYREGAREQRAAVHVLCVPRCAS